MIERLTFVITFFGALVAVLADLLHAVRRQMRTRRLVQGVRREKRLNTNGQRFILNDSREPDLTQDEIIRMSFRPLKSARRARTDAEKFTDKPPLEYVET